MPDQHSWITPDREPVWKLIYEFTRERSTIATRDGMHLNQPYPLKYFGDLLDKVDRHSEYGVNHVPWRFLDAGCGNGQLMAIATFFGLYPDGFDIDPEMVAAAEELGSKLDYCPDFYVWQDDWRNFTGYDKYDVIVLNRLSVSPAGQALLERTVYENMRPHTYLVKLNNVTVPVNCEIVASNQLGGYVVLKK